jgi:hypothetical protein
MTALLSHQKLALLVLTPVLFTGCSSRMIPAGSVQSAHLKGGVHGGLQPVAGATIQLFDVTENLLSSTPLISTVVTSDANGGFSITGDYTCPAASDQVYLVATGGDPGSGENDGLVLMTALGNCGDLSSSTFTTVNEVSTIATIYAYAAFFDPTQSAAGYITGGGAPEYAFFRTLVDPASGTALSTSDPNSPNKLNALANSLAACVNAATVAGVTQPCNDLITMAGPVPGSPIPQDSAIAAYMIATNPTYNPTAIFNDAVSNPPFMPTLVTAPADWTIQ